MSVLCVCVVCLFLQFALFLLFVFFVLFALLVVEHVYRKYNADVDGVCNAGLDWVGPHATSSCVIAENWNCIGCQAVR